MQNDKPSHLWGAGCQQSKVSIISHPQKDVALCSQADVCISVPDTHGTQGWSKAGSTASKTRALVGAVCKPPSVGNQVLSCLFFSLLMDAAQKHHTVEEKMVFYKLSCWCKHV